MQRLRWSSRRWRAGLLGVAALVVVLIGAGTLALTRQGVHASGSGGGACFPVNGPSCTFKGQTASVSFDSWDAQGCVFTSVGLAASENFTHTPPGATSKSGPGATVTLFQFNFCTFDFSQLIEAFGFADGITFHTTGNLDSASASGTVTLTDFGANAGAQLPTTFDVTWNGTGNFTNTMTDIHTRGMNFSTHTHMIADSRIGIASGSIVINGTNYITHPGFGSLLRAQGGEVQIIRN